jgi:sigma-B regulation protein RsbU (phosphoserine phosphatase)
MFVTAWMGILDLDTKILEFTNAGHNPPIIFNEREYKKLNNKADFVLGGMENIKYKSNKLSFKDGDRIFIYTDGIIEAINREKEIYGEDRLIEFLNKNKDNHSNELLVRLKEDIDDFANTEPQFDDITMLYFELKEKNTLGKMINKKTFLADDGKLDQVFSFIEESLVSRNISNKIVNSLNLAVEEIFVNISHYGYGNNEGTVKIEVYIEENSKQIKIKIIDNGKPFNPLLKDDPDISLSAEERDIGGLGIFITKKIMDEVLYEYKDKQNILILTKNL